MDGQTHVTPMPASDPRPRRRLRVLGGGAATICLALAGLVTTTTPVTAAQADRIGGTDRIDTAIKVFEQNREVFTSDTAVLTRSDNFADPLTATPLAAALKAPVLTTAPSDLDDRVLNALKKQGIKRIIAIGGENALTPAVLAELTAAGITPERVSGPDRYATAHRIADLVMKTRGQQETAAYVATGNNFPDALAAGTAAAATGAVVMLSQGNHLDDATRDFLTSPKVTKITAVGGPAAAAMKTTGRDAAQAVGANRYETAVLLAKLAFTKPGVTVIASGETYADSLAGGALAALLGGPLLLTPAGELAPATKSYLGEIKPNPVVLGGPSAVSPDAIEAVQTTVGTDPDPTKPPTSNPTTPTPNPPSTRPPGNSGGGGGGTNTAAGFRITSDLPAEVRYPLGWWTWEFQETNVEFDSTEGVTFEVWTRPVGGRWAAKKDAHVSVVGHKATFRVGGGNGTAGYWNGTQVQLLATKNGATVRSAIATVRGVKPEITPTVTKDPAVTRVTSSALVTRVPVTYRVSGMTSADQGKLDVFIPDTAQARGDRARPVEGQPGTFAGVLEADRPGTYTVRTRIFPEDPFKIEAVEGTDEGAIVLSEDPSSPLHHYRVTLSATSDRFGYKVFNAQVRDGSGSPVTTGGVVFRYDGGHYAIDTDGSNGWTGYGTVGDWPVSAAYVANTNAADWAAYASRDSSFDYRAFEAQPAKYSNAAIVPTPVDRAPAAELTSTRLDAISSGSVETVLTSNGSPVGMRSLMPNTTMLTEPARSKSIMVYPHSDPSGPLPTVVFDAVKNQVLVTGNGAPPGDYTTYVSAFFVDEIGRRNAETYFTFTIK